MIRQIQTVELEIRSDEAGDGHYHAPRAGRQHNGIDFACQVDAPVLSPVSGVVTKHGYAYPDDLSWRYIEITDGEALRHRLFYVYPTIPIGYTVTPDTEVGRSQNITIRYPGQGMTPHIHYGVKNEDGEHLNPAVVA